MAEIWAAAVGMEVWGQVLSKGGRVSSGDSTLIPHLPGYIEPPPTSAGGPNSASHHGLPPFKKRELGDLYIWGSLAESDPRSVHTAGLKPQPKVDRGGGGGGGGRIGVRHGILQSFIPLPLSPIPRELIPLPLSPIPRELLYYLFS